METFDDQGYYQKYTPEGTSPWRTVWSQREATSWAVYLKAEGTEAQLVGRTVSRRQARRIVDEIAREM